MRNRIESVLTSKKQVIVLIAILSLLISAAGYYYYKHEEGSIRKQKYEELKTIADLKQSKIEQWQKQRNAEVTVISHGAFLTNSIPQLLQGSGNEQLKQSVLQRLRLYQKEFGYENIFLATINGKVLLSAKTGLEEVDTLTKQKITKASIKKEIAFSDFFFCQKENKIHYDIIIPIISSENKTIAILLFRGDPNDFLFPLIETWPTPSKSAETVILRVENDSVVFLNELSHRKNTALKLKIPLTQIEVPAVQAALGRTGIFEGVDYHGVEVLSDIRIIPATNWIMISKVDRSEIYADLYLTAGVIAGVSIFLIIICGVGFAFIYSSRQKNIFMELYSKEKELWQHQEKFKVTMDSLGDGVITTDSNGKIQYLNKIAEELTGWNFREARGKELYDIYPLKNEETGQRENNILDKIYKHGIVKELANNTLLISKSGKEIPVMDTGSPIYDNDGSIIGIVIVFQDETEKRHKQKLLTQSETRYRNLVDNSLVGVYESTSDGKVLYGNNALIEMLGFKSLEEFLSAPAIMHHKNPKRRDELISELKQHGKVENFENEVITNDGRDIHILVSAKLTGNVLSGMVVDVSARKLTEMALRASDALLQSAINILPVGLWIFNAEGKIVISSAAAQRIWAGVRYIDVDQLGEYKGWRTDSGKLIEAHEWAGARALEKGETSIEEEVEIECFDGTHKIILDSAVPLRKSDGSIGGAITINQDITKRKNAEKEIAMLAHSLKSIIECVSITDMEDKIIFVNESFLKTYGYNENELVGKHISLVGSLNNPTEIFNDISSATLSEGWQGELWNKRKDGSEFQIHLSTSLIKEKDGKSIGLIGVAKDITERKRAEKELIESKEKAESANKLKDAFINNMSHEIRTPLNGILGLSNLIKENYARYVEKEDEFLFTGMDSSAQRIIRTVDMILNFSRLQTGDFSVLLKEINLLKICEHIIKQNKESADVKNLELIFDNLCGEVKIIGDEYSITQAISNLVDNAIKYTKKGFVSVSLLSGSNDELIHEIKDSGIGIGEEYLEHLYEPYRQEDMGYGRAFEGVGLGLSLVKKFLDLNNAHISVVSKKGEGTTFTVTFKKVLEPLGETGVPKKIITKVEPVNGEKKRMVLLVEDDIVNQVTTKRFLQNGYDTLITDSSDEAIDLLEKNKVDIILMDISISGSKNGLELTKVLKTSKEYKHIPIIVVTAHAFDKDRQNALAAGCDDYLAKPFSKDQLLEKIDKFVNTGNN